MAALRGATRRRNSLTISGGGLLALGLAAACTTASPPRANDPAPPESWLAAAERHIAEREYRASANGAGLQAPNRAHNLRTYFESTGIRVHDRTADGSPELLQLSLARIGRGDMLSAVAPGEKAIAHDARVEIRHGDIVEWYVNSPAGLEQGFTLETRPHGTGPLVVELAVSGARPALRGGEVVFETGAHRELRYGELHALDVTARELPARLEVSDDQRLRIVVDDARANYPLVIDPLLITTGGPIESKQTGAHLGSSIAGAGDVNGDGYADVIVGAPDFDTTANPAGAAFVFHGSAGGLVGSTAAAAATQIVGDEEHTDFGRSVAGAGDVDGDGYSDVIVAADDTGGSGEQAVFLYLGSPSGILDGNAATAAALLDATPGYNLPGTDLGYSMGSAGDVNGDGYDDVIVGAPYFGADPFDPNGAVFLFHGAPGIGGGARLTPAWELITSQTVSLGQSVAGAGDVNGDGFSDVVIGASRYDSIQNAAFVFLGTTTGVHGDASSAAARIDGAASVGGAGDVNSDGYADVIVGNGDASFGQAFEGAAFVFHGSAAGIIGGDTSTASSRIESNQDSASLGWRVAAAGDVNGDGYDDVVVAASRYDGGETDEGAAFVFLGGPLGVANGDPTTAFARFETNQSTIGLSSISGAGDLDADGYADVIVGVPGFDAGEQDEGAAFPLFGGPSGMSASAPLRPTTVPDAKLQSDEASARLGFSVAAAGDVNGDDYDDVIVGAPYFDAGQTNEGAAFVFHGSASGIASASAIGAVTQLESDLAFANFGEKVAGAGDVNGDGFADVIVGDPNYQNGAAFVFHGGASGVADGNPTTAATRLTADPVEMPGCPGGGNAGFGGSVAGAGDVNGDGFDDVILGAPRYPPCSSVSGVLGIGAAFVFTGSASGVADASSLAAASRIEGTDQQGWLGASVAGAGDVNGDGFADVIVGAPLYTAIESDEGAAFVYHGSSLGIASGTAATAAAQLESNQARASFGSSVAGAGDVNGDDYADVIVGAPFFDRDTAADSNEGAAFVFLGSASGVAAGNPSTAAVQIISDQDHSALGVSVAGAGDVDADGFDDVLAGASLYEIESVESGAAFLYRGGGNATSPNIAARMDGSQVEERFGATLDGAGDVDGDGHADVIVGAPGHNDGETDEGAAFVYLPEPGSLLSLAAGAAWLALLRRRRA